MICIDGAVEYVDEADLTVADRSYLLPGAVVVSASDPGGQIGVVTDIATALDGSVVVDPPAEEAVAARGVSPAQVRRVRELCIGDYVVSGGQCLGRVLEAPVDIDVQFDDGAVCRETAPDGKQRVRALDHQQLVPPGSAHPRRSGPPVRVQVLPVAQWQLDAGPPRGHRREGRDGRCARLLARIGGARHQ